jgi:hypothetical protein
MSQGVRSQTRTSTDHGTSSGDQAEVEDDPICGSHTLVVEEERDRVKVRDKDLEKQNDQKNRKIQ